MKKITLLLFALFATVVVMQAQTLDADLKAKQAEVAAAEEALAKLQGEADALASQIEKNAGWITGYTGLLGFDFNKSNNWIQNPNANASSSSLNIGLTGYANTIKENFFWRNKGVITRSWQDIDLSSADGAVDNDKLFDNGTVDILNISSLAGKPISDLIAISGLGELNTSMGNFLNPGTIDFGVGVTLTPNIDDLVVVIHPLNYHFAFGAGDVSSASSLGAKIRADYTHDFGKFQLSSTLTSFVPYGDTKILAPTYDGDNLPIIERNMDGTPRLNADGDPIAITEEQGLFEYTWLNTVTFNVWNGIGVGISFGLRNANYEYSPGVQNFYSLGLSYSL